MGHVIKPQHDRNKPQEAFVAIALPSGHLLDRVGAHSSKWNLHAIPSGPVFESLCISLLAAGQFIMPSCEHKPSSSVKIMGMGFQLWKPRTLSTMCAKLPSCHCHKLLACKFT